VQLTCKACDNPIFQDSDLGLLPHSRRTTHHTPTASTSQAAQLTDQSRLAAAKLDGLPEHTEALQAGQTQDEDRNVAADPEEAPEHAAMGFSIADNACFAPETSLNVKPDMELLEGQKCLKGLTTTLAKPDIPSKHGSSQTCKGFDSKAHKLPRYHPFQSFFSVAEPSAARHNSAGTHTLNMHAISSESAGPLSAPDCLGSRCNIPATERAQVVISAASVADDMQDPKGHADVLSQAAEADNTTALVLDNGKGAAGGLTGRQALHAKASDATNAAAVASEDSKCVACSSGTAEGQLALLLQAAEAAHAAASQGPLLTGRGSPLPKCISTNPEQSERHSAVGRSGHICGPATRVTAEGGSGDNPMHVGGSWRPHSRESDANASNDCTFDPQQGMHPEGHAGQPTCVADCAMIPAQHSLQPAGQSMATLQQGLSVLPKRSSVPATKSSAVSTSSGCCDTHATEAARCLDTGGHGAGHVQAEAHSASHVAVACSCPEHSAELHLAVLGQQAAAHAAPSGLQHLAASFEQVQQPIRSAAQTCGLQWQGECQVMSPFTALSRSVEVQTEALECKIWHAQAGHQPQPWSKHRQDLCGDCRAICRQEVSKTSGNSGHLQSGRGARVWRYMAAPAGRTPHWRRPLLLWARQLFSCVGRSERV
jgi:hypothetical protein